ncbi:MAG: hypothetical protein H7Y17_14760 [Chlorobia bacterium]|nr:hypothetical protein [Fimbriimonadaceae bacterium]
MKASLLFLATILAQGPAGLLEVGTKYGHKIEVRKAAFTDKARGYEVAGDVVSDAAIEKYAPLWIQEWSRYPRGLMAKAKVAKVVFSEKLSLNGQLRAAVPAFDLETMYFDPALGAHAPTYQRGVVHHEFFHMLDFRMGRLKLDPDWMALNPKEFKYGSGGKNMRTQGVGNLTTEIPGFLTPYGTSALEEDKAELFAHLIVSAKFVMDQAAKDPVLAAKIDLLKRRMQAYDAGFNDSFWHKPKLRSTVGQNERCSLYFLP